MFDDELKKIWQNNLAEIKENKVRFTAVFICFIVAVILFFTDENSVGEEINLSENPAPVETVENVKPTDSDKKIITVKNAAVSTADKNINVVRGANSDDLYIYDPFKTPQKEIIQPPPEIPTVIIPPNITPPVAQIPVKTAEKFILRGTAIIGNKKSALIQKFISDEKNSDSENLILEIGDSLNGKKILDINQDYLTLDDGEILHIDILTP